MTNQPPQIDKLQLAILRTTADDQSRHREVSAGGLVGSARFDQWSSDVEFGPLEPDGMVLGPYEYRNRGLGTGALPTSETQARRGPFAYGKDTHVKTTPAGRKALSALKAEGNGAHG